MEVLIGAVDELAKLAAGAIERLLGSRPDAVLGLATGSSPLSIYDELISTPSVTVATIISSPEQDATPRHTERPGEARKPRSHSTAMSGVLESALGPGGHLSRGIDNRRARRR